jgi:hypothetical protein
MSLKSPNKLSNRSMAKTQVFWLSNRCASGLIYQCFSIKEVYKLLLEFSRSISSVFVTNKGRNQTLVTLLALLAKEIHKR